MGRPWVDVGLLVVMWDSDQVIPIKLLWDIALHYHMPVFILN